MLKNKKILLVLTIAAVVILIQKLDLNLVFKNRLNQGQVEGVRQEIDSQLKVVFFDMGEADSILIKTPNEKQILVDGGEQGNLILQKLKQEMDWNDSYIDLIVSTHPHADHLGGLINVLKRYKVGQVWMTGIIHSSNTYLEFLNLLKEKNISTRIVYSCGKNKNSPAYTLLTINNLNDLPKTHCLDELRVSPVINLKILHPLKNLKDKKIENLNNSSIVLKLNYDQTSLLLMGDAETPSEDRILKTFNLNELKTNVLKVAHQGASDSSSKKFLQAAKPDYAIILVGANNSYGHPSLRIIRRLEKLGIKIFRSDKDGDIKLISDGEEIMLDTFK